MIKKFSSLSFQNKKILLAVGLFLTISFLASKILVGPDLTALKKAKMAVSQNAQKKALLEETAALENRLKALDSNLSKSSKADWLIETASRTAAETGLSLVSASPQDSRDDADYPKIVLLVEAAGSYHNLGRFAEKMESHKPFIKINNLRIARQGNSASGDLRFTMTLEAYSQGGQGSR